jgi:hypothetical protein
MRSPGKTPAALEPVWLRPLLLALCGLFLLGLFSPPIVDTDFWWHLRTGQYMAEKHMLPAPDPFAWTTGKVPDAYPSEGRTRNFNLTHEWLAQAAIYLVWRVAGFAGVAIVRAASLTLVCWLVGLICARRSGSFYAGVAGALAAASVLATFALDRPYQITFLFLAMTLAALDFRRGLWGLPVLFAVWANCHGGYFLGFVMLGAWCAQSLWERRADRTLWLVTAASVAASALNPNGLGIFRTLIDYNASYMQGRLLEWAKPSFWPPAPFSILLAVAAALMLYRRRKVSPVDWLLLAAFGAAATTAVRNTAFLGIVAPVLIAGVWTWRPAVPAILRTLSPALLAAAVFGLAIAGGHYQFHAALWKYPAGAADFLRAHGIDAPLFNTYEHGGYLIWRGQRVFIDGRALSDRLFGDYARILYNHADNDGQPSGEQLLDRYGVGAIVMNTFEPATGSVYVLAPALADPAQKTWKLVYHDAQSLVFLRTPPPGMRVLNSLDVLTHMEQECSMHLENEPQYPLCARSLGDVFLKVGDQGRARRWLATYLERAQGPDPAASEALQRLVGAVGPPGR